MQIEAAVAYVGAKDKPYDDFARLDRKNRIFVIADAMSSSSKSADVSEFATGIVLRDLQAVVPKWKPDKPLKKVAEYLDVVMEEEIVKNLTHLHRMDYGGRKYYLLERENITKMIQAVTEGTYTDLILVNKKGIIIYTMNNDDIL